MVNVTLICVGKGSGEFLGTAFREYEKRLRGLCTLKIVNISEAYIPSKNLSRATIEKALDKEGDMISKAIPSRTYVVPLCVEGKILSSEDFASLFREKPVEGYSGICFIIGSSYGLSPKIKNMGDLKLSLSGMTFTHGIARLMLLEQIYRAMSINIGGKYHK